MSELTVVFVCAGNTCRSPLAMGLARKLWPAGVVFRSAGLLMGPPIPAAAPAQAVAGERGVDLSDHRSRSVDAALIAEADWLIAMTRSQVAQLNARRGDARVKIGLIGCPNQDLAGCATPAVEEVDDPYGADLTIYRHTADQLERLLLAWQPTFGRSGKDDA